MPYSQTLYLSKIDLSAHPRGGGLSTFGHEDCSQEVVVRHPPSSFPVPCNASPSSIISILSFLSELSGCSIWEEGHKFSRLSDDEVESISVRRRLPPRASPRFQLSTSALLDVACPYLPIRCRLGAVPSVFKSPLQGSAHSSGPDP